MDKKQLLTLRALNATPAMIKIAKEDEGEMVGYRQRGYKYGIFLRCQNLGGILKVAMFYIDELKKDIVTPHYEIFLNPEGEEYITYDLVEKKWRTAKIDMLNNPTYCYYSGRWGTKDTNYNISHYLKQKEGGYRGILKWQQSIKAEELRQKHRRETIQWDLAMDQVPDVPKDWEAWVQRNAKFHYIFYDYSRNVKTGYCTSCKQEVPIKSPKHNAEGKCPRCHKKITYKSKVKGKNLLSDYWGVVLLQRCEDGMVLRKFSCHWNFNRSRQYNLSIEEAKPYLHEYRRIIYDEQLNGEEYEWADYKHQEFRWVGIGRYTNRYYRGNAGSLLYPKTIPNLEKDILKKTGLSAVRKSGIKVNVEEYLEEVRKHPITEKLAKAGLTKMAAEQVQWAGRNIARIQDISRFNELHKKMGISKEQLRIMQKYNLGTNVWRAYLRFPELREEAAVIIDSWNIDLGERHVSIFEKTDLNANKLITYLERQRIKNGQTGGQIVRYYEDYLHMAEEREMSLKDDIVRLSPDFMKWHNRYLEEKNRKANEKRFKEVNKKFPKIREEYFLNKQIYEFEDKNLIVIVPKCAADIVQEGQLQHHCVGASDTYMSKMNRRDTFICFIRKKDSPEVPYYTIEISHDNKVMQSYAAYDRQPDLDKIKSFEEKWIAEINKRIKEMKKQGAQQMLMEA